MSDKPWQDVMAWYANETGLAFNSVDKPPTGTFAFTPPKDPKTGQPKQYTLSEITDIINESLLAKNFVLIRGETTFRLWPASEKIDPALVRRVSAGRAEDAGRPRHGSGGAAAQDAGRRRAGDRRPEDDEQDRRGGRRCQGQNALLMIDFAGNLQRIVDDLKASEEDDNSAEQYSHKCEYVKARDAATHLKELLGVEDTAADGRAGRAGSAVASRGGGGFDPRIDGGRYSTRG